MFDLLAFGIHWHINNGGAFIREQGSKKPPKWMEFDGWEGAQFSAMFISFHAEKGFSVKRIFFPALRWGELLFTLTEVFFYVWKQRKLKVAQFYDHESQPPSTTLVMRCKNVSAINAKQDRIPGEQEDKQPFARYLLVFFLQIVEILLLFDARFQPHNVLPFLFQTVL